jgi:hypothetical protein
MEILCLMNGWACSLYGATYPTTLPSSRHPEICPATRRTLHCDHRLGVSYHAKWAIVHHDCQQARDKSREKGGF